jgi:predicted aspartyl protease
MKYITRLIVILFLFIISCKKEIPPNSIPFSTNKGVPIITVAINGKSAKLLVDTGATTSVIDSSVVEKYGFRVGNNLDIDFNGIGGRASMYYVDKAITTFNGEPMYIRYRASNMKNIRNSLGIVGIIGTNYLEQNKMIINYQDKLLEIKGK